MPPEPTFSRSHLSAFRNSLMAMTTAMTRKTRPLSQHIAIPALPSCCHKQRHATRAASSKEDEARPMWSPASESPSCASSPAASSSPPSSPPQSPFSPVPGAEAKKVSAQQLSIDRAGTLTPPRAGPRWHHLASDDTPALRVRRAAPLPGAIHGAPASRSKLAPEPNCEREDETKPACASDGTARARLAAVLPPPDFCRSGSDSCSGCDRRNDDDGGGDARRTAALCELLVAGVSAHAGVVRAGCW